ncbi:MAG TPA: GWxTD domain-containing protein [Ignavibacteriales bacterium]|nr:GWxTD domain-containing protein [Ignavibacteriales bacterium]
MRYIILIIFLINVFVFSQQNFFNPLSQKIILVNYFSINPNADYYIITLNPTNLVFEKLSNSYNANFSITINILDSNKNSLYSQILDTNIVVSSFNETQNQKFYFSYLITTPNFLQKYFYEIIITQTNKNIYKTLFKYHFYPYFVGNVTDSTFILNNFGNNLLYSKQTQDLLLRVDYFSDSLIFIQDKIIKTVSKLPIISLDYNLKKDINKFSVNINNNNENKYYVVKNINQNFYEGTVFIKNKTIIFPLKIKWFNKPISLSNLEYAITKFKLLFNENKINNLKNQDSITYAFFRLWKMYDKDTLSSYNEAIEIFYNRVDEAIFKFTNLAVKDGSETDMGKIYILYGEPDNIKRTLLDNKRSVEIWEYKSIKKKFYFEDNSGLGNFKLISK